MAKFRVVAGWGYYDEFDNTIWSDDEYTVEAESKDEAWKIVTGRINKALEGHSNPAPMDVKIEIINEQQVPSERSNHRAEV